jgi:hypothetical protein
MEGTEVTKAVTRAKIDVTYAATLRTQGMTYEEIARIMQCSPGSLRVAMHRTGANKIATKARQDAVTAITRSAQDALQGASERLRGMLSKELERTTDTLATVKPKRNLGDIEARSKVAESIARTAKIVHDWGADSLTGLVVIGQTRSADAEEQPAIDVQVEQVE